MTFVIWDFPSAILIFHNKIDTDAISNPTFPKPRRRNQTIGRIFQRNARLLPKQRAHHAAPSGNQQSVYQSEQSRNGE